ncbi:hypothetical protein [Salinimicrobium xinjiangense]|uniref:hypothetical protein n=1 Tax=Salinimicrobium xinjiangense TaxID=438596 RepID=UPI000414AE50|nr:hypothetical protein [Salinimicrobium xinjiangense]
MGKVLLIIIAILTSAQVEAQFFEERASYISLGPGLSAPYEQMDLLQDPGVFAQGEYVLSPASWIDIRPYAGLILTKFKENSSDEVKARYRSSANALLFGGKTRLTAPIPFVAPFFEIGIGASIGSFETFMPAKSIEESGVFLHIPVSLGLVLEAFTNVDIKLTGYFHNDLEQFVGAAAVGLSFPIY